MPVLEVRTTALPGRDWGGHTDVVVGLQHGREPVSLVPADAPTAVWRMDLDLGPRGYRGPWVQGRPGERFVYLTWLSGPDAVMFRRLKVWLPEPAREDDLVLSLELTDARGGPLCGSVHPDWG